MTVPAGQTMKRQIVLAAERLFAAHGIDGVSLRQIRMAVGNANNSAVHYHFGSKDQLIQAIFEYRLDVLSARREELVAELGLDTVRSWVECHLRSVMEQAEQPESHYMRFLSQLTHHPSLNVRVTRTDLAARVDRFHARLDVLLADLDKRVRAQRIVLAEMFMIQAAAERERARDLRQPVPALDVAVADLVNAMVAFLEAPAPTGMGLRSRSAASGTRPFVV